MKIRLETADGGLVHESQIPPFNEEPRGIMWGNRLFYYFDVASGVVIYREGFTYALTDNPNTTSSD
jgi:hypothetical protein